ncbi:hypothetical protein [Streptomyces corynorhini]|nr:hypothetical protein [Streptomyces corynorhini]
MSDITQSPATQAMATLAHQISYRGGHQPMTAAVLLDHLAPAVLQTLAGRCHHVTTAACRDVILGLPPVRTGETRREYALRLRAAAQHATAVDGSTKDLRRRYLLDVIRAQGGRWTTAYPGVAQRGTLRRDLEHLVTEGHLTTEGPADGRYYLLAQTDRW